MGSSPSRRALWAARNASRFTSIGFTCGSAEPADTWGAATSLRGGTPPSIFIPLDIPSSRATTHRRVGVGVLSMKYSSISRIARRRNAVLFPAITRVAGGGIPTTPADGRASARAVGGGADVDVYSIDKQIFE